MKGQPLDMIQGLKKIADDFSAQLSVKEWTLGIDCIVYASGANGIGYHADNSQGESVIGCIVLHTGSTPRTVMIKSASRDLPCISYRLQLGQGSAYVMNGAMQKHYVHKVPKLQMSNKHTGDMKRIVLVFRVGDVALTVDSGKVATVETRFHRPDPVQFGAICGVDEGEVYHHRHLMKTYAHRIGVKGINGNMHDGCDAIIMTRNCPNFGGKDSK